MHETFEAASEPLYHQQRTRLGTYSCSTGDGMNIDLIWRPEIARSKCRRCHQLHLARMEPSLWTQGQPVEQL